MCRVDLRLGVVDDGWEEYENAKKTRICSALRTPTPEPLRSVQPVRLPVHPRHLGHAKAVGRSRRKARQRFHPWGGRTGAAPAARACGVRSEFVLFDDQSSGRQFARQLRVHLRKGNPAILLSKDFEHWVALIGYLARQRKFIIVDPKEKTVFFRWSETSLIRNAWNAAAGKDSQEPDQYFAILLSRRDRQPPKWRISESWLRLCERGSADTAEGMANDLAEMAALASPDEREIEEGPYLAEFLEANEELIIGSITHWAGGNGERTRGDLRTFYRDYTTVASSSGIRIAPDSDTTLLVAQLTALFCSYWWGGRF